MALGFIIFLAALGSCYLSSTTQELAPGVPSAPPVEGVSPRAPTAPPEGTATTIGALPVVVAGQSDTPTPTFTPTFTPTSTPEPEHAIVFAVIGDYGSGNKNEGDVAALVKSWQPDFIITTGDNNYPSGSAETIDATIGQFYHDFIYPYQGDFGQGADQNRFFPTLGNHDWMAPGARPYLNYFTLPGNERYYDFTWGPVQLFALDADSNEPDGVGANSSQADWLQQRMAESTAPWKIVYMHQPPYSSGLHGSTTWMRWPFQAWGATAVLAGHDHTYERLSIDGLTYFVNGVGGGAIYAFENILAGSQVRYNDDYGAMRVEATTGAITFQMFTRAGEVIDTYEVTR